jgi:DNA ligase (NAD+)
MAWKFQGDSGQTTLVDVSFSLSRTGTITPVAVVEPVNLSRASVTRATLHNLSNLRRLNLHLGDTLLLTRRGGVIPHVEGNRGGGAQAVEPPAHCPSCGQPTAERRSTRRVSGQEVVTETLHCSLPGLCPAVRRERLLHFTAVLEMDGFGDKIVDGLLERELAADAADLFALDEAALLSLPRMGELLARRLLGQIEASRQVAPATLLVALGIDTLGRHAAGLLAARWTLEEILGLSAEDLAGLHSLGEITAERIVSGLAEQALLIERLLAQVQVRRPATATSAGGPLAGQLVVFTGALERLNRRDAQQLVVRLGGKAGSSITAKTTLVVVGGGGLEAARPSSKLKKARALAEAGNAMEIISEEAFHERLP